MTKVPEDPNMTGEVKSFLDDISRGLDGLTPGAIGAAGLTQADFMAGLIKTPIAQDYRIVERVPYGMTVTNFTAKTSAGTVTAALKINSTAITGGSINVTSTRQSSAPSAANAAVEDDALVLTLSSPSSAADLSFTVDYTRTLDS